MKKIKLLYRFLFFTNILFIALLLTILCLLVIPDLLYMKRYEDKAFGVFHHLIEFGRGILLLLGLIKAQQGLKSVMNLGFYNTISEVKFKTSGFYFIIFAVFSSISAIITYKEFELNILITTIIQYYFVLMVGIGFNIISDFIKNGMVLKEDVDLTI